MKNIRKSIIMILVIIMVNLLGSTLSNAASVVTFSSNSKLVVGETVTINVNLASGYKSSNGTLEYDSEVFESVEATTSGKSTVSLNNNVLAVYGTDKMTTTTQVATIKLKVKANNTKTNTRIKLKSIEASSDTYENTKQTAYIDIESDKAPTPGIQEEPGTVTPTPATDNKKNDVKNDVKNTSSKNNTKNAISSSKTTSKKLPKAGDVASIVVISAISIIAIVAVANLVRYSKNKDIK